MLVSGALELVLGAPSGTRTTLPLRSRGAVLIPRARGTGRACTSRARCGS